MENLVKDFLYSGVGLVSLTAEKLQKSIDELIADSKVSKEEGQKIMEELKNNSETKKSEFETKLKTMADEFSSKFDFLRNKDVAEIKSRLAVIEAKLGIETVKAVEIIEVTDETEAKKASKKKEAVKA